MVWVPPGLVRNWTVGFPVSGRLGEKSRWYLRVDRIMDSCFNIFCMEGWYFLSTDSGTVITVIDSSSCSPNTSSWFFGQEQFMTASALASKGRFGISCRRQLRVLHHALLGIPPSRLDAPLQRRQFVLWVGFSGVLYVGYEYLKVFMWCDVNYACTNKTHWCWTASYCVLQRYVLTVPFER